MKYFSLIYQGDVHVQTNDKILPAEEYSTLMEAYQILEKAKEDAQTYKIATERECQDLRAASKEEGFNEGLAQFYEHLLNFQNELKKIRHEMHQQVLPLALKAAKKIVGRELQLHPETIVDIVLQAIAPVSQNRQITIYVNKAEKEILEANRPRIKQILEQIENFSIQERSDVSPGGCIIETETGIINAGIENQWRALEAAFERYSKR